jgi:hypothetical protein
MVDWIEGFLGRIEVLLQVLGIVGGIFFIIYTAIKSRGQFVPIITSVITSALFIWALFNVDWFTDNLGEDSDNSGRQVDTGRFGGTGSAVRPDWLVRLADGRSLILIAPASQGG